MMVEVTNHKGLWKKNQVSWGHQWVMLLRVLNLLITAVLLCCIKVLLLSDIVLVLRRVHNLGRIRMWGPLHATPTTLSAFSNRVHIHSLLACAKSLRHIYTTKNKEKLIQTFHQTLGVQIYNIDSLCYFMF